MYVNTQQSLIVCNLFAICVGEQNGHSFNRALQIYTHLFKCAHVLMNMIMYLQVLAKVKKCMLLSVFKQLMYLSCAQEPF